MTPAPTAIEPLRVLVLTEGEQNLLLQALAAEGCNNGPYSRIAYGDEYWNEVDELTRRTLRKRRLESEVKRENRRIAELEPVVIEQWAERGSSGETHDATGAKLRKSSMLWAKLAVDVEGLSKTQADELRAQVKAEAGAVLRQLDDFDDLVREDFNLTTLSARFREDWNMAVEAELAKPEAERRPLDPNDLLPEALRGLLVLDVTPKVEVRS